MIIKILFIVFILFILYFIYCALKISSMCSRKEEENGDNKHLEDR